MAEENQQSPETSEPSAVIVETAEVKAVAEKIVESTAQVANEESVSEEIAAEAEQPKKRPRRRTKKQISDDNSELTNRLKDVETKLEERDSVISELKSQLEAFNKAKEVEVIESKEDTMSENDNTNNNAVNNEALAKIIDELKAQVDTLQSDSKRIKEVAREEINRAKLEVYREEQIKRNSIMFSDVVVGDTKEAIDASIKDAVTKQQAIAQAAKDSATKELLSLHPSLARTVNPKLDPNSGDIIETHTYKGRREIAKLDKNEFRKFQNEQKRLLLKKGLIK
tara:strand:- start:42 stop:887 length:846 start_codon:yes stop_codon:yes gene_type:complete